MSLFKKVAAFTDLHVGLKGNSLTHLQDCEEFVDWFIKQAKDAGCDTGIFLGDWHHQRNSINLVTLDTSVRLLEKLGKAFDQFIWFPGNHDLFFRDKRDVHSSSFGRHIPGVTVVDSVTTINDVTLVPWLVKEEWKAISKSKSRYIFGHLELPTFMMNAMVAAPDHGLLQPNHFQNQELVFSGHFHKRQNKGKIWYIGNAFPHDFADSWDDERGMMIMEWGGTPEFHSWKDAPKYRSVKLSQLIEDKDNILKSKMYLKVTADVELNYEEAIFLKESFMSEETVREFSMIRDRVTLDGVEEAPTEAAIQSVDQIVTQELLNISSEQFSSATLLDIWQRL
jgi:DNA repair exonuclease SbcCD nuclease subunit